MSGKEKNPKSSSGADPRPSARGSGSPAREKTNAASPEYFPEDERSSMDWEDDHSNSELDIEAEIAASQQRKSEPKIPAAPAPGTDSLYFPEDERSSMDWEDDPSSSEIDIDAEIEAKLGKEQPDTAPAAPSKDIDQPERKKSETTGLGRRSQPEMEPAAPVAQPSHDFYAEDERSSMDWEDDHSDSEIDLDAEIASKLDKQSDAAASTSPSARKADAHPDEYFVEDERSSMDWEDDHSDFDPSHDHDPQSVQDDGHKKKAGSSAGTVEPPLGEDGSPPAGDDYERSDGQIHPGLAASLEASMAFAARGYSPRQDEDKTDNSEENISVADDVSSPDADQPATGKEESQNPEDGESRHAETESGYLPGESAPLVPYSPSAVQPDEGPVSLDKKDEETPDDDEEEEEDDEDEEEDFPDETSDQEEEAAEDRPMTLRDHLNDLRKRLLRAFLFMIAGFIVCYPFAEQIFGFLFAPLMAAMPETSKLIFTSPPEAFFTFLKVAFVAGIFVSSPLVFYQIWAFIAPGLYKEEKLYIVPVAIFSAIFFISGGAFCYFVAFPFAFEFFMSFNKGLIQAMPALSETLSFVLQLLLAFGIVFELPLFIFFLARLGIVTADMMRRFRRYALLVNVIVAAILTPPDVMSQMLMAGPLLLLYELSILIAAVFGKKKPKHEEEEEEEDDEEEDGTTTAAAQR